MEELRVIQLLIDSQGVKMLIQHKKIFLLFFILIISLLCCTINLFCAETNIQISHFTDKSTKPFDYFDNTNNKVTDKYYAKRRSGSEKKLQQIYSSASGETEPWSNAFNFKKVWGTTVDPRTGILSAYVKTGSMLSNLGHGPDISLNVNYSSSALANPDGLGTGWSWNLTHFNPVTRQLTTSFGQNFYLKKQPDGHWWPLYHKLHDMVIRGDISTHFVITYANGLRETLNHKGYEVRLEQQDGWDVNFSYIPGTHLLQLIKDTEGHSIKLYRKSHNIRVVSQGGTGKPVVVLIDKKNNEIRSITLPLSPDDTGHGIYFYYAHHFMTGVNYPTGLSNRITYNCTDEIKVPSYSTSAFHALCAVIKEIVNPGFGEPIMVSRYRYGKTNSNEHNYLSFNAKLNITTDSSKDRLFEAPVSYTYQTEQDNGLIREIRTYNKYHLMTDEQQVSDRTGHILSAIHYFFCHTDQSDGCAHTAFTDLPATYCLPLKIITRVWGDTEDKPAVTKVTARYDKQGRVIRQTDTYGRVTVNHYCPLSGDTACPAVSKAWPFAMLTESTTWYPADIKTNINPPLPVTTYNYYRREVNHNGRGYIAVLDHQTEQSGSQQLTTIRHYYDNPNDLLTYGLLKQLVVTGKQNETDLSDSVIKDYYYVKSADNHIKTTYSAIELPGNKSLMSSYATTSLFTNQLLMITDTEKKYSNRYHYDQWDRLIKTERVAGTDFAAIIYYNYTISKNLNQVMITGVNGLQQKVIFDSTGRVLRSFTESIDKAGKQQPGHWWPVQKTSYDQYGRIIRKSSYVTDKFGHTKTLETIKDYDDTGRVIRMHLPDGRMTIMHYDDSNRCVVSYQQTVKGERSVISVSKANVLSHPVKQWVLPVTTGLLPSVRSFCLNSNKQPEAQVSVITYDGFGRQTAIQDPVGRIIRKNYDSLGRLTDIIDPAGNKMHSVYNFTGQIIQSWMYPVSGGRYLLSSSGYNQAGQLIWNAGEDGKRTFYTYTTDGVIATITAPNRHIFSWKYNYLNLPISQFTDNKQQWIIDYDRITLNIQKETDITGTKTYFYSDDGLIQQLIHTGKNNYSDYKLQWNYDNNRRIINTIDISGNKTDTQYDWLGRITRISYQPCKKNNTKMLLVPVYDNFSRIQHISYGSGMYRIFHYDAWGYQNQITDTQRKQLISAWSMLYDINGNIIRISQIAEKKQFAVLHYQYDMLDNLISMQCQGALGLPLCPHDTSLVGSELKQAPVIVRQNYTFTPLNRLAGIRETLQSIQQKQTINKVINYHYTDTRVPLRLQQITTAWNQNRPALQNFAYDAAGNMIVDGQNNHIIYNALNEVTRVISSTGKLSDYTYDGSGKEVMEKSTDNFSYLFYCGNTLVNEKIISSEQGTHIIGYLGMAKTTDGVISEYYQSSYKGDIIGVFRKNHNGQYRFKQRNIYSPYGMVWHKRSKTLPLYQQTLQGFDGERTDSATGWQFLGNGNRTYNPAQHYFLSEDTAGDGYAFGSNNPVMNTDPSGNSPRWLREAFKWADYVSTLGLSALHQRWANITAAIMQTGCTVATLGAAVAGAGSAALAGVVTGAAAIGSIPVAAAAIPANKGLNLAGKIIGMGEMAVSVAAGALNLLSFSVAGQEAGTVDIQTVEFPFRMLSTKSKISSGANISAVSEYTSLSEEELTGAVQSLPKSVSPNNDLITDLSILAPNEFLDFENEKEVSQAWLYLRGSSYKDNIECDTGTILLAYHFVNKCLKASNLADFLFVRNKYFYCNDIFSKSHPYFKALNKVLEPIQLQYSHRRYNLGEYTTKNLIDAFDRGGNCIIASGYNHIALIKRIPENSTLFRFGVYHFFDKKGLDVLYYSNLSQFFYSSDHKKVIITGYMLMK